MSRGSSNRWLRLLCPIVLVSSMSRAEAQVDPVGLHVVPVPFAVSNLELPNPAHEGARVTLKAVLRNATCDSGYDVWWDVDRDNDFDEEVVRRVWRTGETVYDIGRVFEVPEVVGPQTMPVNVRARDRCSGEDVFGTFRLFVYDWTPSPDPRHWSSDQVTIMTQMALQEALWWLHRRMGYHGGSGSAIRAYVLHPKGSRYSAATNAVLTWAMTLNGHQPAYPPGTVDDFGQGLPEGWEAQNDARWAADPYAETMIRAMNYIVYRGSGFRWVSAEDESELCDYDDGGNEVACGRIPGTTDRKGVYAGGDSGTYLTGKVLGAIATTLPVLHGTRLQIGASGIKGQTWEWYVQQLTDYLGYMQIDAGCARGGWYYGNRDGWQNCDYADASTAQWAYIGMESAEVAGKPYGVMVANRHKYRIADNLISNQQRDGGSSYRTGWNGSAFQLTGGAFVAARWMGIHSLDVGDLGKPWAAYTDYDATTLRNSYDRYLAFTANLWASTTHYGTIGWESRLWQNGDYLCGNTDAVYNGGQCGNTYAMYSHQKGYRTGQPELETVGSHDWSREFNIYYMRAQSRDVDDYWNFGKVEDRFCTRTSVTCHSALAELTTGWASLVLTPTIFKPKPVAIGVVQPPVVVEGCSGGQNGTVEFRHDRSFHPNADARIMAYFWDADESDGLWWETGAPPDFVGGDRGTAYRHQYQFAGDYTATLRIVDDRVPADDDTATVQVTVVSAPPAPPAVSAGGPYVIQDGEDLILDGNVTDQNMACGEAVDIEWDINGDGIFGDVLCVADCGFGPGGGLVWWGQLDELPRGVGHPISLRAIDETGNMSTHTTMVTIYDLQPNAVAFASPNPAACHQRVSFDATDSFHSNPNREITQYQWDVDGNPGFEGGGLADTFAYTYDRFGHYPITLVVTDDLGNSDETHFTLDVSAGNRAPVARTSQWEYVVLEGQSLTLDATLSFDPDVDCGDVATEYTWDINGDGDFDDVGIDTNGAIVEIPWAVISTLEWPADRFLGEPINHMTLRVTDSFGQSGTVDFEVAIYSATPEAYVVQTPDPAPINLSTGIAEPILDGRESRSPIPEIVIVRHDWDLNDDGIYEVQNQPMVEHPLIFDPLPPPDDIPEVFVRLKVYDDLGQTATTRVAVRYAVPPTPPTADADPTDPPERAYHVLVGDPVVFDASSSFDPDTEEFGDFIVAYRWDIGDDGVYEHWSEDDKDPGPSPLWTITPEEMVGLGMDGAGRYDVRLEIEDTTQLLNHDTTTISIYDREPQVNMVVSPNPTGCNSPVALDASSAFHPHPDIEVVSWAWDLDGDGQFDDGAGPAVTARFDQFSFTGPQRVRVRVLDSAGNSNVAVMDILVSEGNLAPVPVVEGPLAIVAGEGITLDARDSWDPNAACGDEIVAYEWDINGDGTFEFVGETVDVSWATLVSLGLDEVGGYSVNLRVRDRFDTPSERAAGVDVYNGPTAIASVNPTRAGCNQLVEFNGSASFSDGPASAGFKLRRWHWDFDGDGIWDASGKRVNRNIIGSGSVTATLRVTDYGGRWDEDEVTVDIDVANLAPVADAGEGYSTGLLLNGEFDTIRLDARGSYDPNEPCDNIVLYAWDTDNDGLFGEEDVNGAGDLAGSDYVGAQVNDYASPAWEVGTTQVVRVRVRDDAGEWSVPAEAEIRIFASAPPSGEILSPRGDDPDTCIASGDLEIRFIVADPQGDVVAATAVIGGDRYETIDVDTPNDGTDIEAVLIVDADAVPEGDHDLILELDDGNGAVVNVDAGGRMPFDRTGPDVVMGHLPGQDVCYRLDQIPAPVFAVTDALDPTPTVEQVTVEDSCMRTLTVTATDMCGNVGEGSRDYVTAQALTVGIAGVDENAFVSDAAPTWSVAEPPICVLETTATLSRDGGPPAPWVPDANIDTPGHYALEITTRNCAGVPQTSVRSFRINANPIAQLHPFYEVDEGEPLWLDATRSTPPEEEDLIAAYKWDLDNDGVFEDSGGVALFDTSEQGWYGGWLQITDSLGASDETNFAVLIHDVDPIIDSGGPYVVDQGEPLELNATRTRSGAPAADPITWYEWDFGDGSLREGSPELRLPVHAYAEDGLYTASLTVLDEDSGGTVLVPITVRDVNPQLGAIEVPHDIYESRTWTLAIEAVQGAPEEPITMMMWDFGDGSSPVAGENLTEVDHLYKHAGMYQVVVLAQDKDSASARIAQIEVREITLLEVLEIVEERVLTAEASPFAIAMLQGVETWIGRALWGERFDHRGNTLLALSQIVDRLAMAQAFGFDVGNALWLISRTLERETWEFRQSIWDDRISESAGGNARGDDALEPDHPSLQRADSFLEGMAFEFEDPTFEEEVSSHVMPFRANDMVGAAGEAYFYYRDAVDYCKSPRFDGFRIPDGDPLFRVIMAEEINRDLAEAIAVMSAELQTYVEIDFDGPGREQVIEALIMVRELQELLELPLGIDCGDLACITDAEALRVQIGMMELAANLNDLLSEGVYSRNWQACLVQAVKFRVELAVMRLSVVCPRDPVTNRVISSQADGLKLIDDLNDISGGLDFFRRGETRCLAVEAYNECLVRSLPELNLPEPYPEYCENAPPLP